MSGATVDGVAGLPALVVGLGLSGEAAAWALLRSGAGVRAVDTADTPALRSRAAALAAAGADVRVGPWGDPGRLLRGRELVVTSPGVPPHAPLLAAAAAAGVPVWSEPELAWRLNRGRTRLVAVTGTNGKTTTTEMLAACLGAPAVGNIGTPLVSVLAGEAPPALVVAELSSFQLHFAHALRADVAVLLNVAPDHLDWHGSMCAYAAAKARVWANQRAPRAAGGTGDGQDRAVVNADDPGAAALAATRPPPAPPLWFTLSPPDAGQVGVVDGWLVSRVDGGRPSRLVALDALALAGRHDHANAAAAATAALCAGAGPGALAALAAFRPGPHRMERLGAVAGVAYVNDSKATNPHAAAAALTALRASSRRDAGSPAVVWIAGGLDKGLSFEPLAEALRAGVRAVVTIGRAGPEIAALARAAGLPAVEAGQLREAVRAASALAERGDTVLLAPACASMDQFSDYAERGRAFRGLVAELAGRAPGAGVDV